MTHKRRRTTIDGAFAPRTIEMISSPAFAALSLSARRVLDRIEIELGGHGGTNNGNLPVTYADFMRFGIDNDAIAPAVREVVALGFVEVTRGRAGNSDYRLPNVYRLTYRHTDHDNPSNEWKRINPDTAKAAAKAARDNVDRDYNTHRHRKRKASRGKPEFQSGETGIESLGETPTTAEPRNPRLLTISPSGSDPQPQRKVATR